jgi:hypothetical protein
MSDWLGYGIPAAVLLLILIYGVWRTGWFGARDERRLNADTSHTNRSAAQAYELQRSFSPEARPEAPSHMQRPSLAARREPNGVEPEWSEEDIQRAQFGPRGIPGGPDPARMTPQRHKKTPTYIDPGHTS